MAANFGVKDTAGAMNVSVQSIRNWKKEKRLKDLATEPAKFSEEFKELAVERAAVYGPTKTAAMMGVSEWSIRKWTQLKKQYGNAGARDPLQHKKKEEPKQQGETLNQIVSSSKWARALYGMYAKDQSEDGFARFQEDLKTYVDILAAENKEGA